MEGSCSTGQSPQRAAVPVEEEEEEEEESMQSLDSCLCYQKVGSACFTRYYSLCGHHILPSGQLGLLHVTHLQRQRN
jgi:hypothetical protein